MRKSLFRSIKGPATTTVLAVSLAVSFSGCLSTSGPVLVSNASVRPAETTATQRAIGQCVVTIGGGAIAGGILDKMLGGSGKSGAILGAAMGAETCVVLLMVAAEEDQERVRDLEYAAIESNRTTTEVITTTKGESLTIHTKVSTAPVPDIPDVSAKTKLASGKPKTDTEDPVKGARFSECRYAAQTLSSPAGKSVSTGNQLWCLPKDGTDKAKWTPMQTQKPGKAA